MTKKAQDRPSSVRTITTFSQKSRKGIRCMSLHWASQEQETPSKFFYESRITRKQKKLYQQATHENCLSMVHQQNAPFHLQETGSPNASASMGLTYDEPLQICTGGTEPTRMQANQITRATTYSLLSQERQGPGRSRQATPAANQDFSGEGHHPQLSFMPGEWDL
jgi:hypothetical protein